MNHSFRPFYILTATLTVFAFSLSCRKQNEGVQCNTISGMEILQNGPDLRVYINSTSGHSFQISVTAENQNDPANELKIETNETNPVFSLIKLKLKHGNNYLFCVREKCGDTYGEWKHCKWLHISDYAYSPYDLSMIGNTLMWKDSNSNPAAQRYHVLIGNSGFDPFNEEGVMYSCTTKEFGKARMYPIFTYDFYVQSYIDSIKGWSQWAGPIQHECTSFQDFCLLPTDVSYKVEFNDNKAFRVSFRYETNGQNAFQTVVVPVNGSIPPYGKYPVLDKRSFPAYLVQPGNEFDFYVRTICNYSDTSEWTGKTRVKIP